MRRSRYDADRLAPVVRAARSFADVLRALGLPGTGGNYRQVAARIRIAQLDTGHFGAPTLVARCHAVTAEVLAPLVAGATSVAQVLGALGLPVAGRAHRELSRRIRDLALDTSHWRGRGWSRGDTATTNATVARIARRNTIPDKDLFVAGSFLAGPSIVKRLLARGWSYACAACGLSDWRGQPLTLHLDHINGAPTDNRLENLRLLCPNCHAQTPTYSNRRR